MARIIRRSQVDELSSMFALRAKFLFATRVVICLFVFFFLLGINVAAEHAKTIYLTFVHMISRLL